MKRYIALPLLVISAILVLFNTKYVAFAAKQRVPSKGAYITEFNKMPTPDCDKECRISSSCGNCCRSYSGITGGTCRPGNLAEAAVNRCYCSYLKIQSRTPAILRYCSGSCISGYSGERHEKCRRCCNDNVVGVEGGYCRGTKLFGTYGCYCTPKPGNKSRFIIPGRSKAVTRGFRKFQNKISH